LTAPATAAPVDQPPCALTPRPALAKVRVVPFTGVEHDDWASAASALLDRGWCRLPRIVDEPTRRGLVDAAPGTWSVEPEIVGRVRQRGRTCGVLFDGARPIVRDVGLAICDSLNGALPPGVP